MDSPRWAPPRLNPEHLPTYMSDDQLEPLITECPGCQTRFRASEAQLQQARGRVRCGACLTVFNGIHNLVLASGRDYADEAQAQRALDALLDELSATPAAQPSADPADDADPPAAPALRSRAPGRTTIFSGFEDAAATASAEQPSTNDGYRFQVLDDTATTADETAAPEASPAGEVEPPNPPSAGAEPERAATDGAVSAPPARPGPEVASEPVVFGEPRAAAGLGWLPA